MKSNSLTVNRKALAAFLLSAGLIGSYPMTLHAEDGIAVVQTTQQQKHTVSGIIKDSYGDPIIGASILEKGTSNGTITGLDGDFKLDVAADATLVISYIGYKNQEVTATPGRILNITLEEDTEMLDEVVVVGYGVQKKSDVTGSVTSVPKERLGRLPVTNVLQAVQGAAAGVTITQTSGIPGDAPDALVRGRNSINASSGPYVVVDGVPISKAGGSLNDINPNDVESMEILKDASATAIYGTNGANGVILITTKRGTSGKPVIRYNGYFGIEDFTNRLEFADGYELSQRYKDYSVQNNNAGMFNENVKYEYEADNYANGRQTDWIDAVSQTGIIQNHGVNVSGGAENVKYYISADYMDQKGIIKGFNFKRYSIRTNLDMNVTDYLTVGTSTYIVSQNRDGGRAHLLGAEAMSPWARMYDEDGSYTIYPMYSENLFVNPLLHTTTSPERRQFNVNINGYAELDFGKLWKPLQGLKYKFNGGYAYIPKRTNQYEGASVNNQSGWGRIYNEESQSYTVENILSYARDFGKHHVDLTALYAASRKKYQNSTAEARIFITDDLQWHNLGTAQTPSVGSYTELYTTESQMGRVNYSYDSRYLFTFTVRRDGSSVFGANNKYGTFPSVALGWNIARENFMAPSNDWLNNLKLRLSYGKAGNEAIGVYQSRVRLDAGMLALNGSSAASLWPNDMLGNDNLTWETTKSFNIGLDFGLWNNRITGNVDFYSSTTTDLLMRRNLPKISGFNSIYYNMGKTANKGIEVTLNSRNIDTKDFSWASTLVFSWNKNELKDLYGDGQDDLANRWFLGHPLGVIYDYVKVGIWQEDEIASGVHTNWDPNAQAGDVKLADISGPDGLPDGKIDENDRKIQGQTTPKWIGGLTNTFTYKDFSLSIFIQTVQGLKRNNSLLSMAGDEVGRRNTTTEISYWTPENKSNEWKALRQTSNRYNYGYPVDAGFTRVKDITLSYNLPKNITDKLGIGALQMYVSGRNLFTFTDWIGWDPESRQIARGHNAWDATRGETVYDSSNYPMTKSYVFGLNLTF